MSKTRQEFRCLLQRAASGSSSATTQLFREYGPDVVRVVRRRLNPQMRSKFDSEDFAQTVWASFFANPQRISTFEDPQALVTHLATVARNKVVDEFRRRFQTQKHNLNRERGLDSSTVNRSRALAAGQPTPSQQAIANECWGAITQGQPAHYQQILRLRRGGYTFRQIAQQVGLHERTVRRIIKSLDPERLT